MFWVPSVTRQSWHKNADAGGDSFDVIASCIFLSLQKVLLVAEMIRRIKSVKERKIAMVTIQGLYNTAVCYTPELEEAAHKQIQAVCDQAEFAGCKIRIMPDVHAGKGCTIGTTMTIQDKIVPGMVGVDIGCGMETVELREREIDFEKLDSLIRKEIPYG